MKIDMLKLMCFRGECLMRTKEKNQDYIRKYRFGKKIEKMIGAKILCKKCSENFAETLHHLNENHNDNRDGNLLPVCQSCHLGIPHKEEIKSAPAKIPLENATKEAHIPTLRAKRASGKAPNFDGVVTLIHKTKRYMKLRCKVSLKTLTFLESLGYEKIA